MVTKAFVCRRDELDGLFKGWRRSLAQRGWRSGVNPFTREPCSFPTWDPTPDEPFAADALRALDELPGEVVAWGRGTVDTLDMAFRRDAMSSVAGPVLLGPG